MKHTTSSDGTSIVVKVMASAVSFGAQVIKPSEENETVRLKLLRVSSRYIGGGKDALTSVV